jgi:hypothetical protein
MYIYCSNDFNLGKIQVREGLPEQLLRKLGSLYTRKLIISKRVLTVMNASSKLTHAVTLLTYIREVLDPNLSLDIE